MQDELLPGAQLRRAREEKGISREEVSRGLHLSRNYLIALENDEYGKLPEPAFIKGYLRNYARLLGLPGEEVAALYQQRLDRERVSAEEHQAETEESRRAASPRWRLPALIVLVIILALLVAWWLWPGHEAAQSMSDAGYHNSGHQIENGQVDDSQVDGGQTGNGQGEGATSLSASGNGTGAAVSQSASEGASANTQESAPASPAADGDQAGVQSGAPATGADSGMTPGAADAGVTNGDTAEDNGTADAGAATGASDGAAAGDSAAAGDEPAATAPAETGTAPAGQSAEAASGSLAMAFSRVCWIKVVDGSGKTLAVGTQQAGTAMDLQGEAPFRVTIGDAGAVSSVVVDGEQVSLPSQQSGEVIHVTLP